jgi:hypothetical protein
MSESNLEVEVERLRAICYDTQMLAFKWQEAHDCLKSGLPYPFPRPADLPDAIAAKDAEISELRAKLFPYADATEISGISWDGKYLIGDKKSIAFFYEMKNRGEQIDVYKRAYDQNVAAKDAEIERLREALMEWQPIATCPLRDTVDLWCVYGGEEFAQYDGGASIGKFVPNRNKSAEYGFFGNQSNDGVPQRDAPDLVPVAWRKAVPSCPATLIADVLGLPLTREDALKGDAA